MKFHGGSDFRLHDDYGITLSSADQRLMFVFRWAPLWLNWVFSLALAVSELRALFCVSWQFVYISDCFPVVIHWINEEASKQA